MAVDAVRYRSRRRRDPERERAEKAKKEKILLGVCGVVLLALLAFEGPKTLNKLHHSAPPATTTVEASGGATGTTTTPAKVTAASTAALSRMPAKDPFAQQLSTSGGAAAPASTPASGPSVRASHFVAKDPFAQQLMAQTPVAPAVPPGAAGSPATSTPTTPSTPATPAKPSTPSKPGHTATAPPVSLSGNYIVILASIPVHDGRDAAVRTQSAARSHGIGNVGIVNSSSYPTLRRGFYAVYSGPYKTLNQLQAAVEHARGAGYTSAYTRRLAR
jgi:hypothetical protein